MRTYADSSFLVKLLAREAGSDAAVAEYRRLRLPRLFYVPLHALEVENAIRQKAFYQRCSLPSGERAHVSREENAALARLQRMLDRRLLIEVAADWEEAVTEARRISEKRTESTGARSLDLLHVAFALALNCELFLTTDHCQAEIAKAEGMKVQLVSDES
jgi:predicted nucleic acid-binding protein